MSVKNVTHEESGGVLTRVPVKYKVSLGLPRGYKKTPSSKPLSSAEKLFYFLIQSRDENGEWRFDSDLAKRVVGEDVKEPREIKIQLIGNDIDDMIKSDLVFWDNSVGMKCSCSTVKGFFQEWCENNDVPWELPLSGVRSETELNYLLQEGKINKRVKDFVDSMEKIIKKYKECVPAERYEISITDMINSASARRLTKGVYRIYPCVFRKCPDYMSKRCKLNGRFFFIFENFDIADIVTLVTSSPKNIRNIQWGLENIIKKVINTRKGVTMHGISCRLVGRIERGMYRGDDGKQHSAKYFIVSLRGPRDNMIESAKAILSQAREMAELYPGGMKVEFDEGEVESLAKERLNEFSSAGRDVISQIEDMPADEWYFEVDNEKPLEEASDDEGYKEKMLKKAAEFSKDKKLCYMLGVLLDTLNKLPISNGLTAFKNALEVSINRNGITLEKIIASQPYLHKLGSEVDFKAKLQEFEQLQKSKKDSKLKNQKGNNLIKNKVAKNKISNNKKELRKKGVQK